MSKLVESPSPTLGSAEDLRELMQDVKPHVASMPLRLKAKVTAAWLQQLVQRVADSHADEIDGALQTLINCHTLTAVAAPWDVNRPSISAVMNEALTNLESMVLEVSSMNVEGDGANETALEELVEDCNGLWQDGCRGDGVAA